jgi:hypothetical protein
MAGMGTLLRLRLRLLRLPGERRVLAPLPRPALRWGGGGGLSDLPACLPCARRRSVLSRTAPLLSARVRARYTLLQAAGG